VFELIGRHDFLLLDFYIGYVFLKENIALALSKKKKLSRLECSEVDLRED
jgi:hypothetical protein